MQSKVIFDLDYSNNPVVNLRISSSPDVRDKIAKRFIEALGKTSQWCEILPTADSEYTIFPITPEELRRHAGYMIARADELEEQVKKYGSVVEGVEVK